MFVVSQHRNVSMVYGPMMLVHSLPLPREQTRKQLGSLHPEQKNKLSGTEQLNAKPWFGPAKMDLLVDV